MNDGGQTNPPPPSALPPPRCSASMVRTRPNGRDPAMCPGEGRIAGVVTEIANPGRPDCPQDCPHILSPGGDDFCDGRCPDDIRIAWATVKLWDECASSSSEGI